MDTNDISGVRLTHNSKLPSVALAARPRDLD